MELSQLEKSNCGVKEAIRKEKSVSTTLLSQLSDKTCLKHRLRRDVDARVADNEKTKVKNAKLKAEIGEVKQLLQQEVML